MKKVVLLIGLAVLQACSAMENEIVPPEADTMANGSEQEGENLALTDAWLTNELLSDGCDLHFRVGEGEETQQLVASDGSLRKVQDYYLKERREQASIPVKVWYVITGTTRKIKCGWGNEVEYPAIEVVVIKKP